ncbi:unnamed protein product, partial [marine sediment metagenome]
SEKKKILSELWKIDAELSNLKYEYLEYIKSK